MPESLDAKRERAAKIYDLLRKRYPDASCSLDHANPFQLLVATILAAQCTDERVNMVTPALFAAYPTPADLAKAPEDTLQKMIASTGFFRNKSRSLLAMSRTLVEKFGGAVPSGMDELTSLPGVGRKTGNVIRGTSFGMPAIIVDTHCMRLSLRLGFAGEKNPDKIEAALARIIPEKNQTMWSHLMVFHGRATCRARKPLCSQCPVTALCPFKEKMS